MIFGKGPEDWRGNAVVHTSNLRHTRGKSLPSAISRILSSAEIRLGAISVHIPHHATLSATEQILQSLQEHTHTSHKAILGIDANETFCGAKQQKQIKANTARGEMLLHWFEEQQFHMPPQNIQKPTHFPYNTALEPRRLDYILSKHLLVTRGMSWRTETSPHPTMTP